MFRQAREGAGVSLKALWRNAEPGVSYSHVYRWEQGERDLSESAYQHLSLALAEYIAGRWAA
jgi:DNA-binding transcriptional regulator YiaG